MSDAATDPQALLALCHAASSYAPLKPSVQRALHDALTLLTFHFGGHSSFFADNQRNASAVAETLSAWVAERQATRTAVTVTTSLPKAES